MMGTTWSGRAGVRTLATLGVCMSLAASPGQGGAQGAPAVAASPQAFVQVAAGEQPIRLARADMHVDVSGSLVRTVIDLALVNPNPRVLEGELQFPLRDGQGVTGFALDMPDGTMMPAVAVPKARGRQVFEEITRRGADPALLEQTAGDNFRLRVYPLRPGATRHVRIELSEWRAPDASARATLALPLDVGGTGADRMALHVTLHGVAPGTVRIGDGLDGATLAAHDGDTELVWQRAPFDARAGERRASFLSWPARHDDTVLRARVDGQAYFHAEVAMQGVEPSMAASEDRPKLVPERAPPHDITLVWDASASGARRDRNREFRLLAALFAWQPNATVHLRIVRDAAEPEQVLQVRQGDWQALRQALQQLAYDGAGNASLWSVPASAHPSASLGLLFSDGLGNWGPATSAPPSNVPAYAVQSGEGGSAAALRRWAEVRGGQLLDLCALDADAALNRIRRPGARLVRVQGDGVDQVAVASLHPEDGRVELAGRFTAATGRVELVFDRGDGIEHVTSLALTAPPPTEESADDFVARRWAGLRVGELLSEAQVHRGEIESLGKRFALVTPETSLIVLENLADFQRYDLPPPPGPLRDAYRDASKALAAQKAQRAAAHLDGLVWRFGDLQAWWTKHFPKTPAAPPVNGPQQVEDARLDRESSALVHDRRTQTARPAAPAMVSAMAGASMPAPSVAPAAPRPVPPGAPLMRAMAPAPANAMVMAKAGGAEPSGGTAPPEMHIAIQPWSADAPATRRLAQAEPSQRYAIYLDQRLAAAQSPAFYLDAAQVFFAHGERALALRVLSNLAGLHVEDRGLLRVLAYRLQEMGETVEAVRLLTRVTELAPDEPQSWRDLGLAQAALGAWQSAVDALWTTASGTWDARFGDIDVIALGELDAIADCHPGLDLSAVDARLRRNLPLDLRVALAWDTDNVDIDLWVKDPLGEWVSYQQPLSRQGGRISRDVTQGYGPEVFSLRHAIPGRYEVRVKYFASHRQVLGNTTTVMMRLSTGFGTSAEKDRDVILKLEEAKDDMLVGSFSVDPHAP